MSEPIYLCIECRARLTLEDVESATACPKCGTRSIPADLRHTMTATLTAHEWRILTIFASNWDQQAKRGSIVVENIINRLHEQNPGGPPLTMAEEFAQVKREFPSATMTDTQGNDITPKVN